MNTQDSVEFAVVGIDPGKDVAHLVGFDRSSQIAPMLHCRLGGVPECAFRVADLQALNRARSRLVSRRTATIKQIRAFLTEQGIAERVGA